MDETNATLSNKLSTKGTKLNRLEGLLSEKDVLIDDLEAEHQHKEDGWFKEKDELITKVDKSKQKVVDLENTLKNTIMDFKRQLTESQEEADKLRDNYSTRERKLTQQMSLAREDAESELGNLQRSKSVIMQEASDNEQNR
eukprot:UN05080